MYINNDITENHLGAIKCLCRKYDSVWVCLRGSFLFHIYTGLVILQLCTKINM